MANPPLTKQQKMDIMSLVYDLNQDKVEAQASMNKQKWMSVYIGSDDEMEVFTIGGCYGLSFDDGYKKLSSLLD